VDPIGTPFAGGGFNMRLRDLARFGELMRLGGRMGGKQIVPEAAIADIVRGARKEDFASAGYATLPGWSYRNQWWISHNAHGAYTARGIHGQAIYIDPKAEMVIARFASHPMAGNVNFDPTSLPAYQALAEHLMERH
jgi:CubicO group peptidase (beta-lactamase class C family)